MRRIRFGALLLLVLVALPAALMLLFSSGGWNDWMWCGIIWISAVPTLLPLLDYIRAGWDKDPAEPRERD